MTIFDQIAVRIVKEQELIIGPVAWEEAKKVPGLRIIDQKSGKLILEGDANKDLNDLVARYYRLFGRASVEVCRDAVQDLLAELPQNQVPESLR